MCSIMKLLSVFPRVNLIYQYSVDLKQFYLLKTILQNLAVFYRIFTILGQEFHQTQPACSSGI